MGWRTRVTTIEQATPEVKPSWRDRIVTETPEVSQTESVLRGAAQGATFGFADELAGAAGVIKRLPEALDKGVKTVYEQERDISREAYKEAERVNPKSYLAGEVGGSLATAVIPGMAAAKGASLATIAGKSALAGAAQALGSTEKTQVGEVASDVAKGAVVSGIIGGAVGKLAQHLTVNRNLEERLIKDLRPTPSQLKKLGEKGLTETVDLLEAKGLKNLSNEKTQQKLAQAVKETGAKLGKLYDEVDTLPNSGVDVGAIKNSLNSLKEKYLKNPGMVNKVSGIDNLLSNIDTSYGNRAVISNNEMRQLVSAVQQDAYFGQAMQDSAAKKLAKEISSELRNVLNTNVKNVLGENKAQELLKLNDTFAKLSTVNELAKYRAIKTQAQVKPRTPFSLEGLRQSAEDTQLARATQDLTASLAKKTPTPIKNVLSKALGTLGQATGKTTASEE